jgi:hypothetical protein
MMVNIVNLSTMTQIGLNDLQAMYPGTSFPASNYLTDALLAPFGCATFTVDPQPVWSPFTDIAPGPIAQNSDGTYSVSWVTSANALPQCIQGLLTLLQQQYQAALQTTVALNGSDFYLDWNVVTLLREAASVSQVAVLTDIAGIWIQIQPADATTLANSMSSALLSINANMSTQTNNISALTTVAAAEAFDVTTGWPT